MDTFNLLSPRMQKKIWQKKWKKFRPIQDMAIPEIIQTDNDVILSSGTASGKTEAAFLPILSLTENELRDELKALYISPLKALINNQFERIFDLCDEMDITVNRWHGDVSSSKKKKFVRNPSGILQITPESIESLFLNNTNLLSHMFKNLDFIVIDEIHSFIDSDRGVHLRSLLHRLEKYSDTRPRIIGLSATINNFDLVRKWVNPSRPEKVEIIDDPNSSKQLKYSLMYFLEEKDGEGPFKLLEDILFLTKNRNALIFCNARKDVEFYTHMLNRMMKQQGEGKKYFPHHSAISKDEREYTETALLESKTPKSIISTSSLELGIDIGEVDIVIQVDSTFSVSSLKQRLGRSGRKEEASQLLQLYTTNKWSLLQSLSIMELIIEGWVEPATGYEKPYDILVQQILSIVKETNGIKPSLLLQRIKEDRIFDSLEEDKIVYLLEHLKSIDLLEFIKGANEFIVGIEGERLIHNKDFYAVFTTPEMLQVIYHQRFIGELEKESMKLSPEENIILAGQLWKIDQIDYENNKLFVKKAYDGKPPKWLSGYGKMHERISQKALDILCSDDSFIYINEFGNKELSSLRHSYEWFNITSTERIIWETKDSLTFDVFSGTKIINTLFYMLRVMGIEPEIANVFGQMTFQYSGSIVELIEAMKEKEWEAEELIKVTEEDKMYKSKYSPYLPENLKKEVHEAQVLDIPSTMEYLNKYTFKLINLE